MMNRSRSGGGEVEDRNQNKYHRICIQKFLIVLAKYFFETYTYKDLQLARNIAGQVFGEDSKLGSWMLGYSCGIEPEPVLKRLHTDYARTYIICELSSVELISFNNFVHTLKIIRGP
jgi:hypothetical protein